MLLHCATARTSLTIAYAHQVIASDYSFDGGIYAIDLATEEGTRRFVTYHPGLGPGGAMREPRFSPDGKRILFLADSKDTSDAERETWIGSSPYQYAGLRIWEVGLSGGKPSLVTTGHNDGGWEPPIWLNDNTFVAIKQGFGTLEDQPLDTLYRFDRRGKGWTETELATGRFPELQRYGPEGSNAFCYRAKGRGLVVRSAISGEERLLYKFGTDGPDAGWFAFSPGYKYVFGVASLDDGRTFECQIYDSDKHVKVASVRRPTDYLDSAEWSATLSGFVTCFGQNASPTTDLEVIQPNGKTRTLLSMPGRFEVRRATDAGPYILLHRFPSRRTAKSTDNVFAYDTRSNRLFELLSSTADIHGFDVCQRHP